jgi:hypothetical protein
MLPLLEAVVVVDPPGEQVPARFQDEPVVLDRERRVPVGGLVVLRLVDEDAVEVPALALVLVVEVDGGAEVEVVPKSPGFTGSSGSSADVGTSMRPKTGCSRTMRSGVCSMTSPVTLSPFASSKELVLAAADEAQISRDRNTETWMCMDRLPIEGETIGVPLRRGKTLEPRAGGADLPRPSPERGNALV